MDLAEISLRGSIALYPGLDIAPFSWEGAAAAKPMITAMIEERVEKRIFEDFVWMVCGNQRRRSDEEK